MRRPVGGPGERSLEPRKAGRIAVATSQVGNLGHRGVWSPTQGHAAGEVCTSLGSRQAGSGVPARDPLPRGLTVTRVSLTLTL